MTERVNCINPGCERMILPTTAESTGGLCMPCFKISKGESRIRARDPYLMASDPHFNDSLHPQDNGKRLEVDEMGVEELTEVFSDLGARDPESWAKSQIDEGICQLDRFMFLKGAWDLIMPDCDNSWIDDQLAKVPASSKEPFAGIAHSLRRLLAAGASRDDLTELARTLLAQYLFGITYLLDDPTSVEGNDDFSMWALAKLDDNEESVDFISGLHESVLDTDPSGREMRPRVV